MDTRTILSQTPLFSRLAPEALDALAERTELLGVASGQALFEQGEAADSMYIVCTGRLRAIQADGTVLGDIGHHEPIGEIGLLSGENRSVSVYAIRDSILLRIPRDELFSLIECHPGAMIEITRVIIHRLRQNQRTLPWTNVPPGHVGVPSAGTARSTVTSPPRVPRRTIAR